MSKEYPFRSNGFEYEVEAVEDAVLSGQLESDIIPHLVSKQVATIMDEVKEIVKN